MFSALLVLYVRTELECYLIEDCNFVSLKSSGWVCLMASHQALLNVYDWV